MIFVDIGTLNDIINSLMGNGQISLILIVNIIKGRKNGKIE